MNHGRPMHLFEVVEEEVLRIMYYRVLLILLIISVDFGLHFTSIFMQYQSIII